MASTPMRSGRERVADAGAFVHDLDAMPPELVDMLLRLVAGGLDHGDAGLDDGGAVFGVGRRLDRGQDGEVDAKGLVGEVAAARDLLGQVFRGRLGQRRDEAERAGVRDRGDQLGASDPLHAALDDRVLDADELCEPCLQHDLFPPPRVALCYRLMAAGCRRGREMSIAPPCGGGGAIMRGVRGFRGADNFGAGRLAYSPAVVLTKRGDGGEVAKVLLQGCPEGRAPTGSRVNLGHEAAGVAMEYTRRRC
ncbi:hypothetical protein ACVWXQ_008929 [Bradyrhizobium sp. S3.14.4]